MIEPVIPPTKEYVEEPPPLFKKWRGWYLLVAASLVLYIFIFYIFTKAFE